MSKKYKLIDDILDRSNQKETILYNIINNIAKNHKHIIDYIVFYKEDINYINEVETGIWHKILQDNSNTTISDDKYNIIEEKIKNINKLFNEYKKEIAEINNLNINKLISDILISLKQLKQYIISIDLIISQIKNNTLEITPGKSKDNDKDIIIFEKIFEDIYLYYNKINLKITDKLNNDQKIIELIKYIFVDEHPEIKADEKLIFNIYENPTVKPYNLFYKKLINMFMTIKDILYKLCEGEEKQKEKNKICEIDNINYKPVNKIQKYTSEINDIIINIKRYCDDCNLDKSITNFPPTKSQIEILNKITTIYTSLNSIIQTILSRVLTNIDINKIMLENYISLNKIADIEQDRKKIISNINKNKLLKIDYIQTIDSKSDNILKLINNIEDYININKIETKDRDETINIINENIKTINDTFNKLTKNYDDLDNVLEIVSHSINYYNSLQVIIDKLFEYIYLLYCESYKEYNKNINKIIKPTICIDDTRNEIIKNKQNILSHLEWLNLIKNKPKELSLIKNIEDNKCLINSLDKEIKKATIGKETRKLEIVVKKLVSDSSTLFFNYIILYCIEDPEIANITKLLNIKISGNDYKKYNIEQNVILYDMFVKQYTKLDSDNINNKVFIDYLINILKEITKKEINNTNYSEIINNIIEKYKTRGSRYKEYIDDILISLINCIYNIQSVIQTKGLRKKKNQIEQNEITKFTDYLIKYCENIKKIPKIPNDKNKKIVLNANIIRMRLLFNNLLLFLTNLLKNYYKKYIMLYCNKIKLLFNNKEDLDKYPNICRDQEIQKVDNLLKYIENIYNKVYSNLLIKEHAMSTQKHKLKKPISQLKLEEATFEPEPELKEATFEPEVSLENAVIQSLNNSTASPVPLIVPAVVSAPSALASAPSALASALEIGASTSTPSPVPSVAPVPPVAPEIEEPTASVLASASTPASVAPAAVSAPEIIKELANINFDDIKENNLKYLSQLLNIQYDRKVNFKNLKPKAKKQIALFMLKKIIKNQSDIKELFEDKKYEEIKKLIDNLDIPTDTEFSSILNPSESPYITPEKQLSDLTSLATEAYGVQSDEKDIKVDIKSLNKLVNKLKYFVENIDKYKLEENDFSDLIDILKQIRIINIESNIKRLKDSIDASLTDNTNTQLEDLEKIQNILNNLSLLQNLVTNIKGNLRKICNEKQFIDVCKKLDDIITSINSKIKYYEQEKNDIYIIYKLNRVIQNLDNLSINDDFLTIVKLLNDENKISKINQFGINNLLSDQRKLIASMILDKYVEEIKDYIQSKECNESISCQMLQQFVIDFQKKPKTMQNVNLPEELSNLFKENNNTEDSIDLLFSDTEEEKNKIDNNTLPQQPGSQQGIQSIGPIPAVGPSPVVGPSPAVVSVPPVEPAPAPISVESSIDKLSGEVNDKLFEVFGLDNKQDMENIQDIQVEMKEEISKVLKQKKITDEDIIKKLTTSIDEEKKKKIQEVDTNIANIIKQISEVIKRYGTSAIPIIKNMKDLLKRLLYFQTIVLLNRIMKKPSLDSNLVKLFGDLVNNLNKKLDIYNNDILMKHGGSNLLLTNEFQYKYHNLMIIKKILRNIQKRNNL